MGYLSQLEEKYQSKQRKNVASGEKVKEIAWIWMLVYHERDNVRKRQCGVKFTVQGNNTM